MEALPHGTGGELEEIIARYQSTVYGLALAKTGSCHDADDVFQEVFLAYCRWTKPFADEDHRKAWLIRTTLNISKRFTASTWRKKTVPLDEQDETAVFQSGRGRAAAPGPNPFLFSFAKEKRNGFGCQRKEKKGRSIWRALPSGPARGNVESAVSPCRRYASRRRKCRRLGPHKRRLGCCRLTHPGPSGW